MFGQKKGHSVCGGWGVEEMPVEEARARRFGEGEGREQGGHQRLHPPRSRVKWGQEAAGSSGDDGTGVGLRN